MKKSQRKMSDISYDTIEVLEPNQNREKDCFHEPVKCYGSLQDSNIKLIEMPRDTRQCNKERPPRVNRLTTTAGKYRRKHSDPETLDKSSSYCPEHYFPSNDKMIMFQGWTPSHAVLPIMQWGWSSEAAYGHSACIQGGVLEHQQSRIFREKQWNSNESDESSATTTTSSASITPPATARKSCGPLLGTFSSIPLVNHSGAQFIPFDGDGMICPSNYGDFRPPSSRHTSLSTEAFIISRRSSMAGSNRPLPFDYWCPISELRMAGAAMYQNPLEPLYVSLHKQIKKFVRSVDIEVEQEESTRRTIIQLLSQDISDFFCSVGWPPKPHHFVNNKNEPLWATCAAGIRDNILDENKGRVLSIDDTDGSQKSISKITEHACLDQCTLNERTDGATPTIRIVPFGSYKTNLFLPWSDIDLAVTNVNVKPPYVNGQETRHACLSELAAYLDPKPARTVHMQKFSNDPLDYTNVNENLSKVTQARLSSCVDKLHVIPAKMPLLTIHTSKMFKGHTTQIDVSIADHNHNGIRSADLVLEYNSMFPTLRPLALVLKQLLKAGGVNKPFEQGGLSSYALVLMIVGFLQTPELYQAKPKDLGRQFLNICAFYGDIHHNVTDSHREVASFKYTYMGIFVQPPKNSTLFRDNKRVFRYNYDQSQCQTISGLHIRDPLDPSNNVGRPCHNISQIKHTFARAYNVLISPCDCCWEYYHSSRPICENLLRQVLGHG
eukprot:GHVL01023225.1.p1 GENE.GHVL01023225.1~~GHVL01023225.1.p1  ORF type:complete len:721 (+),score=74.70 GHVL01023225.1:94-2256(+)